MCAQENFAERRALRQELFARRDVLRWPADTPVPQFLRDKIPLDSSLEDFLSRLSRVTHLPGGDDRVEVVGVPLAAQQTMAASESVALVCSHEWDLTPPSGASQTRRLLALPFLCDIDPPQKFGNQPGLLSRNGTPATAFVVAGGDGRFVLTAAHVGLDTGGAFKPDLRCVFGYRAETVAGDAPLEFTPEDVFDVVGAPASGIANGLDWVLLELDRPTQRAGLPLRVDGAPALEDVVVSMGHPHGMPMKVSPGAIRSGTAASMLKASLDFGTGNSGSPVLAVAADGSPSVVEGVAIMAAEDLRPRPDGMGGLCEVWVPPGASDLDEYWAVFVPSGRILANPAFRNALGL